MRIGIYSVTDKRCNPCEEIGYIRFRMNDDSSNTAPMHVDKWYMYIRTTLNPGYTSYTAAFEDGLGCYMMYFIDDIELTLIDIYEIYTL